MRAPLLAVALVLLARGPSGAAPSSYRALSEEQFQRWLSRPAPGEQPKTLSRAQAVADLAALRQAELQVWRGRWTGTSADVSAAEKPPPRVSTGPIAFADFAAAAQKYLNALKDSHAYVMQAGDELGHVSEPAAPLRWQRLSNKLGEWGLIRVDRFPEPEQPFGAAFAAKVDEAFQGLRSTRGLILDLRGNAGGDPNQFDRFFDYFASTPVFLYSEVVRKSPAMAAYLGPGKVARWRFRRDGFSEPFPFYYTPRDPGFKYGGKVLVLCDADTVSAAEYFLGALLDNGMAAAAGQRTLGHSGSIVPLQLPNSKLVIALPIQHVLRRDGSALQDRGIAPEFPLDTRAPGLLFQAEALLQRMTDASPEKTLPKR